MAHQFKPSETVDFVVVGSGAAGGVMARELSQAGFTVVVLEQGPRFTSADFEHDELKYNFLSGITNSPEISPQTFRDDPSHTAERPRRKPWAASCVGMWLMTSRRITRWTCLRCDFGSSMRRTPPDRLRTHE